MRDCGPPDGSRLARAPGHVLRFTMGPQFGCHYTITPTNFVTLPEQRQRKKIGEFFGILRVVQNPLRIRLARKILGIPIDGNVGGAGQKGTRTSFGPPLRDPARGSGKGIWRVRALWRALCSTCRANRPIRGLAAAPQATAFWPKPLAQHVPPLWARAALHGTPNCQAA